MSFRAKIGMTAIVAASCVHTVTRYYLPDASNPRFDTDGATQMLDSYMRIQCPERLAAKKPQHGTAHLTITADTSGDVTRAELVSSSGDAIIDGLFGTVAAQLKVDSLRPTKKPAAREVYMRYYCAPDTAVTKVEVVRP